MPPPGVSGSGYVYFTSDLRKKLNLRMVHLTVNSGDHAQ
jgi:hypothetical protein